MRGAEYQSYNYGMFPNTAYQQNVPCARCYTENRPALMMIPAKRSCPSEWTQEYEGNTNFYCSYKLVISNADILLLNILPQLYI